MSSPPRLRGAPPFGTYKPEMPSFEMPGTADCVTVPKDSSGIVGQRVPYLGPQIGCPPAFCVPRKLAVRLGLLPALICMQGLCPVDWIRTHGASGK